MARPKAASRPSPREPAEADPYEDQSVRVQADDELLRTLDNEDAAKAALRKNELETAEEHDDVKAAMAQRLAEAEEEDDTLELDLFNQQKRATNKNVAVAAAVLVFGLAVKLLFGRKRRGKKDAPAEASTSAAATMTSSTKRCAGRALWLVAPCIHVLRLREQEDAAYFQCRHLRSC
jgi:hypothetical protein